VITEVQFYVTLAVTILVWGLLLVIFGVPVDFAVLGPATNVPTIVLVILWAFNRWFWRYRWLHPWLVRTLDLQGTWKGRFESDYVPLGAGADALPVRGEAFLVVRQTFATINAKMVTRESRSETLVCKVVRCDDETSELVAIYSNTPRVSVRDRSEIHFGGFRLRVLGKRNPVLEGEYWTSRKTRGELVFRERNRQPVDDFERASRLQFSESID
jgi:hypothetical protein